MGVSKRSNKNAFYITSESFNKFKSIAYDSEDQSSDIIYRVQDVGKQILY